jgi:hypothetical protein
MKLQPSSADKERISRHSADQDHVSGNSVPEIQPEFTSQAAADIVFMDSQEEEV